MSFALGMIKIFQREKELKRVNSKNRSAKNLKVFCAVISAVVFCGLGFDGASASEVTVQKVIDLTNADRTEKGLSILAENDKLKKAAEDKAEDMIRKNYFSHNSPEGVTPWHWIEEEKYDYDYAGENLAMDFTTAEKMNEAWLASPTHRANVLNEKYKDIGIAIKEGMINGHSTINVVQMFGSGDRNKDEALEKGKPVIQKPDRQEAYFPLLPLGKRNQPGTFSLASVKPIITSPRQNEFISQEVLEVVGRSAPKEKVMIWDDSREIGRTVADSEGWFRMKFSMLPEGRHELKARSEKIIGKKTATANSLNAVSIFVDRSKPQVDYRLYANGNVPNGYLLEASSDKPNCVFEIGGEAISAGGGKTALFSVSGKNLSTVLKAKDQAGNKTTKQIVLANFYQGTGQRNIIDEMAQIFIPEKVFTADSGRESLKNNLGLAIADFNH